MEATLKVSSVTYQLLKRQAEEMRSTPERVAEAIIRSQLGNTLHIEQRPTQFGPQAYLRGTRVAVRHIAAMLQGGRTAEEIMKHDLPHLPAAAVFEAIAYYFDHMEEIEAELLTNSRDVVHAQLQQLLSSDQFARLTGQPI